MLLATNSKVEADNEYKLSVPQELKDNNNQDSSINILDTRSYHEN